MDHREKQYSDAFLALVDPFFIEIFACKSEENKYHLKVLALYIYVSVLKTHQEWPTLNMIGSLLRLYVSLLFYYFLVNDSVNFRSIVAELTVSYLAKKEKEGSVVSATADAAICHEAFDPCDVHKGPLEGCC